MSLIKPEIVSIYVILISSITVLTIMFKNNPLIRNIISHIKMEIDLLKKNASITLSSVLSILTYSSFMFLLLRSWFWYPMIIIGYLLSFIITCVRYSRSQNEQGMPISDPSIKILDFDDIQLYFRFVTCIWSVIGLLLLSTNVYIGVFLVLLLITSATIFDIIARSLCNKIKKESEKSETPTPLDISTIKEKLKNIFWNKK